MSEVEESLFITHNYGNQEIPPLREYAPVGMTTDSQKPVSSIPERVGMTIKDELFPMTEKLHHTK